MNKRHLIATAIAATANAIPALAVAAYPERPITLVVPYGPGGATDISARTVGKPLSTVVPQPVLVVNRAGAGGATGSVSVANAAPDGYTMMAARVGSHTVNPAMKETLPYKISDFRYVGVYEINPVVCAVATNSDIKSMQDIATRASASPGKVRFSSAGVGSLLHLAAVMAVDAFGLKDAANALTHIPLKSGGAAATAVLSGTADFICTNSSELAGFVSNKQMRPLMVTTPARMPGFDAPTATELGKPDLEQLVGWTGIAGPKDLPDEVADKWREWMTSATADKEFISRMNAAGSVIRLMDPVESQAFILKQYETFSRLVNTLGMKIKN